MTKTTRVVQAALGLVAWLPAGASAATICVNPAGGACQRTIQGGVDTAGLGDTVTVGPGVYYENVNVPPGKDGLKIVGAGKVATILDASPFTDRGIAHNQAALAIHSGNVQLKNLTIRNGSADGVSVVGPGAVIQGVQFTGQPVAGVHLNPSARNAQILANEFHLSSSGVVTTAYGTVVKGNVITDADQFGIYAEAGSDGLQVVSNRIANVVFAIHATANGVLVSGNEIRSPEFAGVQVTGIAPVIQRNRITGGGNYGISASCTGACFGGSVALNTVTSSRFAILVDSDGGLSLVDNVAQRTGFGLLVVGNAMTVERNRVSDVGEDCFQLTGDSLIVSRNTATRCSAVGFRLKGSDNYVGENVALETAGNGFSVTVASSARNLLVLNRARDNAAQGFAVEDGAPNTVLQGNSASQNRLDFCDDGSLTMASENDFGAVAATSAVDCVIKR
jgi:hypothetical protein